MLQVEDSVLTDTIAFLRSRLPEEGVALWSGLDDHVTTWNPLGNKAPNPTVHYAVDPQEWIDALCVVAGQGQQLLALVHSHPTAPAVPSMADRKQWYYPDLWCVIVSFAETEPTWQVHRITSF